MRYQSLISPCVVFSFGLIASLILWLIMPEETALAAGIKAMALPSVIFIVAGASLASFGLGALFAMVVQAERTRPSDDSPLTLFTWIKRLTGLSVICFFGILGVTIIDAGSINVLHDTMSGMRRFAALEGVTTFVHASTAAAVLLIAAINIYGWERLCAQVPNVKSWTAMLLCLIITRAILGSERVAIYVPLAAAAAMYMVNSARRAGLKAIGLAVIGVGVAICMFIAGEYFRSYGVKRTLSGLDEPLLSYGANRLLVYYGASVNAAGAMLEIVYESKDQMEPLFRHTLKPVSQLFAMFQEPEARDFLLRDKAEWSGLYNHEFNNVWGFAAPFLESSWVGALFWLAWGFIATRCWLSIIQRGANAYSLAIFGLISAGLIETARLNALGGVHLLIPLILIVIIKRLTRAIPVKSCGENIL
jgi:hypothetical protein